MGSIVISRNDRSLIGQDLLSMNTKCWYFFFSYKQEDLHSDSLGPLMHTHMRLTFKFIVKICLLLSMLNSSFIIMMLKQRPDITGFLTCSILSSVFIITRQKIVCNLLSLFLLKLSFKHRSS